MASHLVGGRTENTGGGGSFVIAVTSRGGTLAGHDNKLTDDKLRQNVAKGVFRFVVSWKHFYCLFVFLVCLGVFFFLFFSNELIWLPPSKSYVTYIHRDRDVFRGTRLKRWDNKFWACLNKGGRLGESREQVGPTHSYPAREVP